MSFVSTNRLDHVVHLTPVASVQETTEQFRHLGFNVLSGGTHEDQLTANALVVLGDGAYFELISFTRNVSDYPPGSPPRKARENHRWASQKPGWVDYGFLGNGSLTERISDIIDARAGRKLYEPEFHGGRKNPDGQVLEWLITSAVEADRIGVLPFYRGDIISRKLRVPTSPASNIQHPNTAVGFSHIHVLSREEDIVKIAQEITHTVGHEPKTTEMMTFSWPIQTDADFDSRLILSAPSNSEEREFLDERNHAAAIYEIGFRVKDEQKQGVVMTPHARIVFVLDQKK
ncbi:hypothetical protein GYMLUDRAFT_85528 [Collybiopsis luxurians FD-317 M1]|uniref:Glyoxalase-like domain-containing protein n=1 Tax=Collybiopsis luxurians FD-317 M1 TaxID=944289 RepID=A0A0D0B9B9_9AGAR|nr:hypothetical protein GYMLUDRAFT_85528 [Collybiopsis luxurians FD-317 M1]